MIHYSLTNTTPHVVDEDAIHSGLKAAESKVGDIGERFVLIEVVSLTESEELNFKLRGEKKPTDCISMSTDESMVGEQKIEEDANGALHFSIDSDTTLKHASPIIGQLVLCFDVIAQNAKVAGQEEARELEWVIEHGVLHLLGFHHNDDK